MLMIRKEQMDMFSAYVRGQFEWRMVKHLQEKFPDRTANLSDERIRIVVQNIMKKAENYRIEYENDIRRFIEYLVIYGTRWDDLQETEWMADILRRDDLSGTIKMDLIDSYELQLARRQTWAD